MPYLSEQQLGAICFRRLGRNVRISDKASIHDADQIEIGDNSRIDDFCVLSGKITLGRNVHLAVFCNIAGGSEGVVMGDFSGLAYGCHVFTQSDDYTGKMLTNPTVPAEFRAGTKKAVLIERHCIVGTGSLIFPGVRLAEGTSVGAMSMVTRATQEWSVYFGIPAKRLKGRSRDLLNLEAKYRASEGQPL